MANLKENTAFFRILSYIDEHFRKFAYAIVSLLFFLWILSNFLLPLKQFMVNNTQILLILILSFTAEGLSILKNLKDNPSQKTFRVVQDQFELSEEIITIIKQRPPKTADLLEASTVTIDEILNTLRRCECKIRILIHNPDYAINGFQKHRIEQRINELSSLTFKNYSNCEIRLYSTPPAIRGRMFDNNIVNVGWYTYSNDEIGFYGHTNPTILTQGNSNETCHLKNMFTQSFIWLWEHPNTVNLNDYLNSLKTKRHELHK